MLESQQKNGEICHIYHMKLRSGLIIRKEACYFEKESTKKHLQKSRKFIPEQTDGHLAAFTFHIYTYSCFPHPVLLEENNKDARHRVGRFREGF